MFVTVRKLVPKTFTPSEAHAIAEEFRRAADQARSLAGQLRSGGAALDTSWSGISKGLFFEEFNNEPPQLLSLADWLMDRANHIESIKVTKWEEVWEQIPVRG